MPEEGGKGERDKHPRGNNQIVTPAANSNNNSWWQSQADKGRREGKAGKEGSENRDPQFKWQFTGCAHTRTHTHMRSECALIVCL